MHIQKVLEQLGHTKNEARVYLAALSLGEATATDIAARVHLPRTSTQVILDALHAAGLVNFYVKKRYRYWVAENPERLLIGLREREAALQAVMPSLMALRHGADAKPAIKIFQDRDGIARIHEDIIATKQPVRAIISWDEWMDLFGEDYMNDFVARRAGHFLHIDLLVPKTPHSVQVKEKDHTALRTTRFLSGDAAKIETALFLYGNKVALISLNTQRPTGVVIEDPGIHKTITLFFEELWKHGKTE